MHASTGFDSIQVKINLKSYIYDDVYTNKGSEAFILEVRHKFDKAVYRYGVIDHSIDINGAGYIVFSPSLNKGEGLYTFRCRLFSSGTYGENPVKGYNKVIAVGSVNKYSLTDIVTIIE